MDFFFFFNITPHAYSNSLYLPHVKETWVNFVEGPIVVSVSPYFAGDAPAVIASDTWSFYMFVFTTHYGHYYGQYIDYIGLQMYGVLDYPGFNNQTVNAQIAAYMYQYDRFLNTVTFQQHPQEKEKLVSLFLNFCFIIIYIRYSLTFTIPDAGCQYQ